MSKPIIFNVADPIVIKDFKYTPEQLLVLKDLETTKTKQIAGHLHIKNKGFCCLGRFCLKCKAKKTSNNIDEIISYEDDSTHLPHRIAKLLRVNSTGGEFINSKGNRKYIIVINKKGEHFEAYSLADLNDECDLSFKEIARFIRQYPNYVFKRSR
jgi:hypothetical protein